MRDWRPWRHRLQPAPAALDSTASTSPPRRATNASGGLFLRLFGDLYLEKRLSVLQRRRSDWAANPSLLTDVRLALELNQAAKCEAISAERTAGRQRLAEIFKID